MPSGLSPERLEAVAHLFESWHEFFLMTGTAAVTLAGLLFVAVSINVETIVHEKRVAVLDLARHTMVSFLLVLIISLVMLIPPHAPRIQAFALALSSLLPIAFVLRSMWLDRRRQDHGFAPGKLRLRRILMLVGFGFIALTGIQMWRGTYEAIFNLMGPICLLLGNATGSAWEMMVEVGRIKARSDAASHG